VARTSESGNHEAKAGPKRLSAEGVALVVKRYVEKLNYDPADFAGHSLAPDWPPPPPQPANPNAPS